MSDPRDIDPETQLPTSEREVSVAQGSSTPTQDEEERQGRDLPERDRGADERRAALDAMAPGDGEQGDTVASRQPTAGGDEHPDLDR